MEQVKPFYDAPSTNIIEIASEKSVLTGSDPKFNSPFKGDGEDW